MAKKVRAVLDADNRAPSRRSARLTAPRRSPARPTRSDRSVRWARADLMSGHSRRDRAPSTSAIHAWSFSARTPHAVRLQSAWTAGSASITMAINRVARNGSQAAIQPGWEGEVVAAFKYSHSRTGLLLAPAISTGLKEKHEK